MNLRSFLAAPKCEYTLNLVYALIVALVAKGVLTKAEADKMVALEQKEAS